MVHYASLLASAHMGVSINGGKFIVENPSINGWFRAILFQETSIQTKPYNHRTQLHRSSPVVVQGENQGQRCQGLFATRQVGDLLPTCARAPTKGLREGKKTPCYGGDLTWVFGYDTWDISKSYQPCLYKQRHDMWDLSSGVQTLNLWVEPRPWKCESQLGSWCPNRALCTRLKPLTSSSHFPHICPFCWEETLPQELQ